MTPPNCKMKKAESSTSKRFREKRAEAHSGDSEEAARVTE